MDFEAMIPFWLIVILIGSLIWLSDIDANDINSKNIFVKIIAQDIDRENKQKELDNNKVKYNKEISQIFKD